MIVVIADDLSGAAELANVAVRRGLSAEVHTHFDATSDADVVCIDTDTRLLPPLAAATEVARMAEAVHDAGPDWVFKKCDSVLRGAVAAEARATATALGKTAIKLVPANPSRGRVIRDGRYFVDGKPLDETLFREDPSHPRVSADVHQLVGELPGLDLPDVETLAQVQAIAAGLADSALPVGAADFFAALLAARGPEPRVERKSATLVAEPALLVCGSAASWPARREQARSQGIPHFTLPSDPCSVGSALRSAGRVLLGLGEVSTPGQSLRSLAILVAETLEKAPAKTVLLEGGATAAAVIRRLNWSRFAVESASAEGVGALRPVGGPAPLFLIKPGSYPWPLGAWPRPAA